MGNWDKIWEKAMSYGHYLGCHQRPDRSFFIKGYQFPVCARCTGVIAGYFMGIILWNIMRVDFKECVIICIPMLIDWGLQYLKIREATQRSRIITGFLGGFGIMDFQIGLLSILVKGGTL